MKNNTILTIILLIVVGVGAFYGGMRYQQSQRFAQFGRGQGMMRFGQGGQPNGRGVAGEIISADSKSITVKMQDGSSKIILFSDSTAINKAAKAGVSDLKTGEQVAVFGQTNSDGSVTAQNIQLNPTSFRPTRPAD